VTDLAEQAESEADRQADRETLDRSEPARGVATRGGTMTAVNHEGKTIPDAEVEMILAALDVDERAKYERLIFVYGTASVVMCADGNWRVLAP
jgi:hypothetical protein